MESSITNANMIGISQPRHFVQGDGAKTAYEILGEEYMAQRTPIVLVGGMSSVRGDWERLAKVLAINRTVVIYDHRGIGDSTFSPKEVEDFSIELLARDLAALIIHLSFKNVIICGFSMGGVVTQQLLFLPYLPTPTKIPFCVTHVILTGTLTVPFNDKRYGVKINQRSPKARTLQERKEIFDPDWLANPKNAERIGWWLDRMVVGRPLKTILMQGLALRAWNFEGFHQKISKDIPILVIHGERDEIEILRRFPWAKMVEIGQTPGQVETLAFGHHWFEYFHESVWMDVFDGFLSVQNSRYKPRL
ncbi:Alpha/Beta hydrolase protein [Cyathus striatus]|nr:Alpha/Beta hydrolase protein [Cyathus striatus]